MRNTRRKGREMESLSTIIEFINGETGGGGGDTPFSPIAQTGSF